MNIYLKEAIDSLRSIGMARTLCHVSGTIRDYAFDWKYGTDTTSWTRLAELDIGSQNKTRGIDYHPTRIQPFNKLFRLLNLPKDAGFVDFGCGKGRGLIMAMELGFTQLVGVEFSAKLCQIARRNIAIYLDKKNTVADVTVIESDAIDYGIKPTDRIFYFFNPFDEVVLRTVLSNIRRSLITAPRKIWIVYYNPVCHKAIDDLGKDVFPRKEEITFNGCLFFVYESKNADGESRAAANGYLDQG